MKPSGGLDSADRTIPLDSLDKAYTPPRRWLRALGWLGIVLSAPFLLWLPLGFVTPLPSMIDVFGIVGMRIPASFVVGGLLLAAIGFHRF